MTERIFESAFHKRYVGGEGEVVDLETGAMEKKVGESIVTSYEAVLAEYRRYVGDPIAELPEEVIKILDITKRTENDGI